MHPLCSPLRYAETMPWYGWLLLALGAAIALTALSLRLLRASRRGRGFLALPSRAKLSFARELLRDPEVPIVAKAVIAVLVGYLALPFDLIPDFIPVVGQLDDLLVLTAAIALLIATIPRDRFDAALAAAREADARRRAATAANAASPPPRNAPG